MGAHSERTLAAMSRTSRLFKLMDALRGRRRPITASQLASELSVSMRTVYRDVQTLMGLGAPIDGGAGVGYLLRAGFFLPPLMFGEEELEALVLGARWVQGQGDPALAQAAGSALAKIATASPRDLRDRIAETGLFAPRLTRPPAQAAGLPVVREAIRREYKLKIRYLSIAGAETERVIWPVALVFFEGTRLIAAWCELRRDFRHFRADRISSLEATETQYPQPRRELARLWRQQLGASNRLEAADS
jgi:predicted DNA-binding transcriptional regulator YafY